ncbi:MAG: hypothetical protein KGZ87_04670 [Bacteroidetes bacterium]|nr:hypothetical protein [Bacteroidota bacterium]
MKNSIQLALLNLVFGVLFSCIGFVNMFWGNDPFFGLFITVLSVVFYLPFLNLVLDKIPKKLMLGGKILIGLFIIWASLGVGELADKIELMVYNFPIPNYGATPNE